MSSQSTYIYVVLLGMSFVVLLGYSYSDLTWFFISKTDARRASQLSAKTNARQFITAVSSRPAVHDSNDVTNQRPKHLFWPSSFPAPSKIERNQINGPRSGPPRAGKMQTDFR